MGQVHDRSVEYSGDSATVSPSSTILFHGGTFPRTLPTRTHQVLWLGRTYYKYSHWDTPSSFTVGVSNAYRWPNRAVNVAAVAMATACLACLPWETRRVDGKFWFHDNTAKGPFPRGVCEKTRLMRFARRAVRLPRGACSVGKKASASQLVYINNVTRRSDTHALNQSRLSYPGWSSTKAVRSSHSERY